MYTGGPGPQLIDGRFELLERLGGGGMGLVWRARDTVLHREVALKEVRPPDPAMLDGDPTAARVLRERVLREARALARLQHPNVVIIHHIVDTPELSHPWLVMELVSGGSLHDRLMRGPLSPPEAAGLGRGVLSALRAAHAAGIQHRDVKPANVLLRPDGTPVLTDFGIAALRESTSLTTTGSLIGSPEYIAPERIRGQEGNPASDLWSLGMMLYVAVEGHHPLRRATSLATLAAVLDEPLPPPVRSGPLAQALSAVLARDPALRPDADRLDQLLALAQYGAVADSVPAQYFPTQPNTPPPAPKPASRIPVILAAVVTGAVVASVLTWTLLPDSGTTGTASGAQRTPAAAVSHSSGAVPPSTAPPAASATKQDLLTPAGMHTLIEAMRPVMGGTRVTRLTVYPDYAGAAAPTAANPKLYDNFSYRDGLAQREPGGGTIISISGPTSADLSSFDWSKLPGLLQKAEADLGIPHPTSRYIIVDPNWLSEGPTIQVYVADDHGGAYLAADPSGRVRRSYPRES